MMTHEESWNAEKLLRISGAYWESCTLHAAVALGIFSLLGNEYLEAEDLAQRTNSSTRALSMLLNALAAMGLLIKTGDRYANTAAANTFLNKSSPHYCGYLIGHHYHSVKAWADLSQAVLSGKPLKREPYKQEEERESFLMGMHNNAMAVAPALSQHVDLRGRKHLIDVGGGPGTYAIFFCLANPRLKATVYDLEATAPFALRTIEQFGLAHRIAFTGGDYHDEDIRGSYDAALLSHVLHAEGPDNCQEIIEKTVKVLEPGGLILVHDFILGDTLDQPLFPALFSLNMLINTPEGQAYSEAQITQMLSSAGVKDVTRLLFRGPNDTGVLAGTV
jgi:predicted O-methyltransferase YrrM